MDSIEDGPVITGVEGGNLSISAIRKKSEKLKEAQRKAKEAEAEVKRIKEEEKELREASKGLRMDEKTALAAESIVAQKVFINIIVNDEMDKSYYRILNEYGDIACWRPISRNEMETVVLKALREGKVPYRLPVLAKNARIISDTVLRLDSQSIAYRQKGQGITLVHESAKDGKGLYFSYEDGLVDYDNLTTGGEYCFRRFFDGSPIENGVRGLMASGNGEKILEEWANRAHEDGLAWMREGADYPIRFDDSFYAWADNNQNIYMDILTMACMPLVKKKAEKAFFLLGEKANGKSALRDLLRMIYGPKNCATIQMHQIGSWDYAGTLEGKILNFPDEENNSVEDFDKSSFKTMAAHGDMVVRQKGSGVPLPLKCDFVSVSPINESIDWDNVDGGVASRIQIVPFRHSFAKDRASGSGSGWAEKKYTPEFCLQVLGELMGLAWAYNEWAEDPERIEADLPIWCWSQESVTVSEMWETENRNVGRFMDEFEKVFVGYQSIDVMAETYFRWIDDRNAEEGTDMRYQKDARKAIKDLCTIRGYTRQAKDYSINSKVIVRVDEDRKISGHSLAKSQLIRVRGELVGSTGIVTRSVSELLALGFSVVRLKQEERWLLSPHNIVTESGNARDTQLKMGI